MRPWPYPLRLSLSPGSSLGLLFTLALTGAGACQSGEQAGGPDMTPTNPLIATRPYESRVPAGYDPKQPTPLLILLHGYSASGVLQDAYFGLSKLVDEKGTGGTDYMPYLDKHARTTRVSSF